MVSTLQFTLLVMKGFKRGPSGTLPGVQDGQKQAQGELRAKLEFALSRLNDQESLPAGVEEIREFLQGLYVDWLPIVIAAVGEAGPNLKPLGRRESVKLLGMLAEIHGDLVVPLLPRILQIVVTRLQEADLHLREACAETVFRLTRALVVDPESSSVFAQILKPLFNALSEHSKWVQMGSAACICSVIQGSPVAVLRENLHRLSTRLVQHLAAPLAMAKPHLLMACSYVIRAVGSPDFDEYLPAFLPCLESCLAPTTDWQTRKTAIEVIQTIGDDPDLGASLNLPRPSPQMGSGPTPLQLRLGLLIEAARHDKVRAVREAVKDAMSRWCLEPSDLKVAKAPDRSRNVSPPAVDRSRHTSPPAGPRSGSPALSGSTQRAEREASRSRAAPRLKEPEEIDRSSAAVFDSETTPSTRGQSSAATEKRNKERAKAAAAMASDPQPRPKRERQSIFEGPANSAFFNSMSATVVVDSHEDGVDTYEGGPDEVAWNSERDGPGDAYLQHKLADDVEEDLREFVEMERDAGKDSFLMEVEAATIDAEIEIAAAAEAREALAAELEGTAQTSQRYQEPAEEPLVYSDDEISDASPLSIECPAARSFVPREEMETTAARPGPQRSRSTSPFEIEEEALRREQREGNHRLDDSGRADTAGDLGSGRVVADLRQPEEAWAWDDMPLQPAKANGGSELQVLALQLEALTERFTRVEAERDADRESFESQIIELENRLADRIVRLEETVERQGELLQEQSMKLKERDKQLEHQRTLIAELLSKERPPDNYLGAPCEEVGDDLGEDLGSGGWESEELPVSIGSAGSLGLPSMSQVPPTFGVGGPLSSNPSKLNELFQSTGTGYSTGTAALKPMLPRHRAAPGGVGELSDFSDRAASASMGSDALRAPKAVPVENDGLWEAVTDLCREGRHLEAYKRAIAEPDERCLLRLMHHTGPVVERLDAESNSRLIRRLIHILQSRDSKGSAHLDHVFAWLRRALEVCIHFTSSQVEDLSAALKQIAGPQPSSAEESGAAQLLARLSSLRR